MEADPIYKKIADHITGFLDPSIHADVSMGLTDKNIFFVRIIFVRKEDFLTEKKLKNLKQSVTKFIKRKTDNGADKGFSVDVTQETFENIKIPDEDFEIFRETLIRLGFYAPRIDQNLSVTKKASFISELAILLVKKESFIKQFFDCEEIESEQRREWLKEKTEEFNRLKSNKRIMPEQRLAFLNNMHDVLNEKIGKIVESQVMPDSKVLKEMEELFSVLEKLSQNKFLSEKLMIFNYNVTEVYREREVTKNHFLRFCGEKQKYLISCMFLISLITDQKKVAEEEARKHAEKQNALLERRKLIEEENKRKHRELSDTSSRESSIDTRAGYHDEVQEEHFEDGQNTEPSLDSFAIISTSCSDDESSVSSDVCEQDAEFLSEAKRLCRIYDGISKYDKKTRRQEKHLSPTPSVARKTEPHTLQISYTDESNVVHETTIYRLDESHKDSAVFYPIGENHDKIYVTSCLDIYQELNKEKCELEPGCVEKLSSEGYSTIPQKSIGKTGFKFYGELLFLKPKRNTSERILFCPFDVDGLGTIYFPCKCMSHEQYEATINGKKDPLSELGEVITKFKVFFNSQCSSPEPLREAKTKA